MDKSKTKDYRKVLNSFKSQLQQSREDLEMYKQLFSNSERKREQLIKDLTKVLDVIDKEKDPGAHQKSEEFLATLQENYGRIKPEGSDNRSKVHKLEKEIDSLQIMLANE